MSNLISKKTIVGAIAPNRDPIMKLSFFKITYPSPGFDSKV
jgi:hypothetical protein